MSAATFRDGPVDTPEDGAREGQQNGPEARVVGRPVVVRRNAGLAALVGAGASAIAIAYLWRATTSGAAADWAVCALMAGLAVIYLAHLVDARTPLLIADDLGMRIRLANQWRGLPWDAVGAVVVHQRRGLLRDGRLVFDPQGLARSLDGLDGRGRRAAALNRRLYGAPLAVPLSLTTHVSTRGRALVDDLRALAGQRAEVVAGDGRAFGSTVPARPEPAFDADGQPEAEQARRSILGGLGTVVSRAVKGRSRGLDSRPGPVPRPAADHDHHDHRDDRDDRDGDRDRVRDDDAGLPSVPTVRSAVQLRAARRGLRTQVSSEAPARSSRSAAPTAEHGGDERENVRPIATLRDPVDAPDVDSFAVQPASDPVIGPELAAARTRVGLTVDELAERTRIRPHVIESIEVDDFAPCGGDFYARGHLRTLARVLGRDPVPLLGHFDRRYATAPIDARRVFEAELATGMTAGARRTAGGPNWALLVGVVLALVLTWGVVRLFAAEPPERLQSPVPSLDGSAGVTSGDSSGGSDAAGAAFSSGSVALALVGAQDGSSVVVRDRSGRVVWEGRLAQGQQRTLRVAPPVDVHAGDAGAVQASVEGRDQGVLGPIREPGHRVFQRPPAR